MNFQPVLLWSDLLLWLLAFAAIGLGVYSAHVEHLRRAWARLGRNPVATGMASILCIFLLIGLVDSLHYRPRLEENPATNAASGAAHYAVEVYSLLDALLSNLRENHEKTYSAPLAIRSYVMETEETQAGVTRDYPRLIHGGAHLADESGHSRDLLLRAAQGIVLAALLFFLLKTALARHRKRRPANAPGFAWEGVLHALGAFLFFALPIVFLAAGYHVFGTDKVGQDVLYQALKSIRTALAIGLVTTLIMLPLAIFLGIVAGYFRGWADDLIQYVYTVLNSIPGVLLIAAAVLMMQVFIDTHSEWFATAAERADLRLVALCFILGVTSWTGLARLLRGETLKLRELDYIQAARAFGVSSGRIITRHLLPNLMHLVIIALVMDFSALVLTEAVLSYIGIGVDPAMMSFGTMINNARMELSREPTVWWSLATAFTFMLILVLSANLLADALRNALTDTPAGGGDPRGQPGAGA
ncbi:MAG: ABC transporter permease [Zoogloeaceae bacterium]|jgi:peptide/nickel transport system permease protein|nr:ABC transporter permease [Zoogloeaceae bacterium]